VYFRWRRHGWYWVIKAFDSLVIYGLKAIEKLIQKGQSPTQLPSHVRQLNAGDYFYNGQEVLNNVKD